MTDIFQSWKENRFIVADSKLIDVDDNNLIVLTNIEYWNENYDELVSWCKEHNAEVRGMTVTCDDHSLTLFALRWS